MSSEALSQLVTQIPRPGSGDVYVGPRPFRTGETLYCRDREVDELAGLLISQLWCSCTPRPARARRR